MRFGKNKKRPDEEPEDQTPVFDHAAVLDLTGSTGDKGADDKIGKAIHELLADLGIDSGKAKIIRLDDSERTLPTDEDLEPFTPPGLEPTEEDKANVKKWSKALTRFIVSGEEELHLKFEHGMVVERENCPLYAWRASHHTLPQRELIIQLGIRGHVRGCVCTERERPYLSIKVWDEDTEEPIEDSGSIAVETPRNIETLHMLVAGAALAFSKFGTI